MYITDSQNSPLKNISDINGQLAYRGQLISGSAGTGSSNLPANATGYLYNDGNGNLSWNNNLWDKTCVQYWYGSDGRMLNSSGSFPASGEPVIFWQDLSSYKRNIYQISTSEAPTYIPNLINSKPAIQSAINTSQRLMITPINTWKNGIVGDLTIFVISQRDSITGYALICGSAERISLYTSTDGGGEDLRFITSTTSYTTATNYSPSTNIELIEARVRGNNWNYYLNGSLIQTVNGANSPAQNDWTLYIGGYLPEIANQGCNVKIGSVIVLDGTATEIECDSIRNYLKSQFSIT